ncbi:hypothetical protein OH76DRAFT_221341 [Lentinus brumalis]|uniref:Uncharacterized protein n=1 Tax=Lentinus brumalis TaxID=2498619 RepID=A0A371CLZ2_9APHY|nr:hypothetical protein OH76DRAFT_221341 [Polyporus brumalis]
MTLRSQERQGVCSPSLILLNDQHERRKCCQPVTRSGKGYAEQSYHTYKYPDTKRERLSMISNSRYRYPDRCICHCAHYVSIERNGSHTRSKLVLPVLVLGGHNTHERVRCLLAGVPSQARTSTTQRVPLRASKCPSESDISVPEEPVSFRSQWASSAEFDWCILSHTAHRP